MTCDLCISSTVPTTDMLFNQLPVSICISCKTAIMMYSDPWDTLVDFATDRVYAQRTLVSLTILPS